VRPGFRALSDDAWARGRPKNRVVGAEAGAWR
jgi:hypothetical protein